ncbi:STAS domain-containing protein [Asanoa iriomotensis]|nr:STAS domain-containing protein [Asanoa iriomotensis]
MTHDSVLMVTARVDSSGARVVPVGEVVMDTADRLRGVLLNALGRRPTALTVDLGEVSFLDSTGIAVLVQGYRLAVEFAVPMTVVNFRPPVRQVLELSGVLPLLEGEQ